MPEALHVVDLCVLGAYLLLVLAMGAWIGCGVKGTADYFLGSRAVPTWAVLLSIVATETSTVTFLSIPGVAFAEGGNLTFLQLALGYVIGRWLVVLLLLPQYFRGELLTAYQVLGTRFGRRTRQAASLLFIVTRTLADGLRLYLTALVLGRVMGWPLPAAVVVMGLATILYTSLGGMRAVIWTDCVQFIVYVAGALLAAWILLDKIPGGIDECLRVAREHNKLRMFDLHFTFHKPYTLWAGIVGGAFLTLGTHGVDQMMVQRYLSARGLRQAGTALVASGFVVLAQFLVFLLIGIGLFVFYRHVAPAKPFEKSDEAFIAFIVEHLRHPLGSLGVVLGALFAAAMSTLSSSLHSSASAVIGDFVLPEQHRPESAPVSAQTSARASDGSLCRALGDDASSRRVLLLTRLLVIGFGVLQVAVGLSGSAWAGAVVNRVLSIAGLTTGITLGLFLIGNAVKNADETTALIAMSIGLAGVTSVALFTSVAWPWYAPIGSLGTLAVGALAGRIRARRPAGDFPAQSHAP